MRLLKSLILNLYSGIFALSFLLALIFTFPSILSISSKFIGDGADNYEYAFYQSVVANNIKELSFPFQYNYSLRYPVGFDFSRSFDSYLTVVPGAILTQFFGSPAGYNITVLILLSLNSLFSYIFFKTITKSKLIGIACGLIYGFSFYAIAKSASHPNLLFIGGFPLLSLSIFNFIFKGTLGKKDFFLFFGAILLIMSASLQYLIFLVILFPILLLLGFIIFRLGFIEFSKKIVNYISEAIAPFASFLLIFLLLNATRIMALAQGKLVLLNRSDDLLKLSPNFIDYLFPNAYLPLFIGNLAVSTSPPSIEKAVYLGFAETIFFIIFFFSNIKKNIKLFLGVSFAIFFVLSLGFTGGFPLPYRFLSSIFPFNLIVETGRFQVIYYLFLAAAIALFLKSVKNYKIRISLITILIVFSLIERLPSNFYLADTLSKEAYINYVKAQNSKAILDIPVNLYYPRYNMLSLYYEKPIVNGYFHWSADGPREKAFVTDRGLVSRYICSNNDLILTSYNEAAEKQKDLEMLDLLKKNGVTTIVIHKDDKFYHTVCDNIRIRLSRLMPFETAAELTSEVGGKRIVGRSITGIPVFNIYLPYAGTFYMDGLYYDPSSPSVLSILLNGQSTGFDYSWENVSSQPKAGQPMAENAVELSPKYSLSFKVPAGSMLSLQSNTLVNNSTLSLWYRYVKENDYKMPYLPTLEKIFEDDGAAVYRVN